MSKIPQTKPFPLVERKSGPKNAVSETDICQFVQIILANIKSNDKWTKFVTRVEPWGTSKEVNRGSTGDTPAADAAELDAMLNYIALYSSKHLLREITERSTSLAGIWTLLRKWAGIQPTGLKILEYSRMQAMWIPLGI